MARVATAGVAFGALLGSAHPALAQRLPAGVTPKHYELRFAPDLAGETFTGTARIEVDVATPRPAIVLNALELAIEDARVSQGGRARYCVDLKQRQQDTLHAWLARRAVP
jgi:aminopeptidase N/puromycin-sensitive aminopeptidase